MAFKMRQRKNVNTMSVIKQVIVLVITLFIGSELLEKFASAVSIDNTSVFWSGLELLGMTYDGSEASFSTTGLIGLVSILAAAQIVLSFVKISW